MADRLKILLVDDDRDSLQLLGQMLQQAGYEVLFNTTAEQALQLLASETVDIVIADIYLPNLSGLEILRQVREQQLPCEVIMLTGFPAVDSAIRALREGAVDYLTKPVTREVLLGAITRVQERLLEARQRREALTMLETGLKRFTGQIAARAGAAPVPSRQYEVGPVMLDLDRYVVEVDGQRVEATATEIEILYHLCRNPDRVVTPQEMIQAIRGYSIDPAEAAEIVRPHISNLRRKLTAFSAQADVIMTVRGVGYALKTPLKTGME
ncbi:MAG TPA: response regulator transcription factor [Anaerolineales bacterium]|nr:response regulator transcription factor [Anaerolineales bacterium]